MLAWHFIGRDLRCRYDRRPVPPPTLVDGEWLPGAWLGVDGKPEMCRHGLHASARLIDALGYAVGPILCRVELAGRVMQDSKKSCAQRRRVIWWADVGPLLREWSADIAEQACRDAGVTDDRIYRVCELARMYARGQASFAEMSAARHSAIAAVTEPETNDIAWAAVGTAVSNDTCDAAWVASRVAAVSGGWDAQNASLADRVIKAARAKGIPVG